MYPAPALSLTAMMDRGMLLKLTGIVKFETVAVIWNARKLD